MGRGGLRNDGHANLGQAAEAVDFDEADAGWEWGGRGGEKGGVSARPESKDYGGLVRKVWGQTGISNVTAIVALRRPIVIRGQSRAVGIAHLQFRIDQDLSD